LVQPSDTDYDEARAVWNGMVDRYPALIVQCAGVADVVTSVNFAKEHDLLVAVRGGGHNTAGNAVCDGGLVIDLSIMKGVRVDPLAQTVRAEGGVTIGDLDRESQAFGLAVPMGVVTATGIAGLTLAGGMGWLRRKYGLSCDNLLSADVVSANGELVTASRENNADLLWALQGGGGNFGVVTSFEFRAYPVGPDVFFAFVIHPGTGRDAQAALQFYGEWSQAASDEISSFAILWRAPEIEEIPAEHHGAPIVVYLAMYAGDAREGEAALQSLRKYGSPIADLSAATPYLEVQRFFDADYPARMRCVTTGSPGTSTNCQRRRWTPLSGSTKLVRHTTPPWMFGISVVPSAAYHRRTLDSVIVPRRISSESRPTGRARRMTESASTGEGRFFVRSGHSRVTANTSTSPASMRRGTCLSGTRLVRI
jgi:FAD/FMN-containing dehydrogenase